MLNWIFKYWFKIIGWSVKGNVTNRPDKFVLIVAPHTATSDFIIGILARSALGINSTKYLGKSQLFKFPYGFIFRALGGYPVERTKSNNLVDSVTEIFNKHDKFSIALAPEGTRSKVSRLKTGFYHIARKAKVPIIPIGFDYSTKTVIAGESFYPTDNIESDFRLLFSFFENIKGKYPERGIDIEVIENTMNS